MSLRHRASAIIGSIFLLLVVLAAIALRFTLFPAYLALEAEDLAAHVQRAQNEIQDELSGLTATVGDYAWWTDTYNFAQGTYAGYADDNLCESTLVNLGINLMWYADTSGQILAGLMVDLDSEEELPMSDGLRDYLARPTVLLELSDAAEVTGGMILLPEGPMLVAAAPILTNERDGPAAGTLLVGRYLDESWVQLKSHELELPLSIYRLDDAQLPSHVIQAQATLSPETQITLVPLSYDEFSGYSLVEDISGDPALLISVTQPRRIFHQGVQSVQIFGGTLVAIASVAVVILTALLQKQVLSRVETLSRQAVW